MYFCLSVFARGKDHYRSLHQELFSVRPSKDGTCSLCSARKLYYSSLIHHNRCMNLQLQLAAFYYEYVSDEYFYCESVKVDSKPLVLFVKVVACNQ